MNPTKVIAALSVVAMTVIASTLIRNRLLESENDAGRNSIETVQEPPKATAEVIGHVDRYDGNHSERDRALEDEPSLDELDMAELLNWRHSRGYYHGLTNEPGAKHPYEFYDDDTLRGLANGGDGLAKMMLAERLRISDENREEVQTLYWQAAVHGYTAALINLAVDDLILMPESTGYEIPLKDEEGNITDE